MRKFHGNLSKVTNKDLKLLFSNPDKFFDKVNNIEYMAFESCDELTTISIPSSVKFVNGGAFKKCNNLEYVSIAKNVNCSSFDGVNNIKYISIGNNLELIYSKEELNDVKVCVSLDDLNKTLLAINKFNFLDNREKLLKFLLIAKNALDYDTSVSYISLDRASPSHLEQIEKYNFKLFSKLVKLKDNCSEYKLAGLFSIAEALGLFLDKDKMIFTGKDKLGNDVYTPICNVAYTYLQGLLSDKYFNQTFDLSFFCFDNNMSFNEEFLKFIVDKNNIKKMRNKRENFVFETYNWFDKRKRINLNRVDSTIDIPSEEKNRYKILTYEGGEDKKEKIRWNSPSVELFEKEFLNKTFNNINEDNQHIAKYLSEFRVYKQKHFDKAVEIDNKRKRMNVPDYILDNKISESLEESIEDYKNRCNDLTKNILEKSKNIFSVQKEMMFKIFTYEMLAKSDLANFAMGLLTNCCVTLYGSGDGAQVAMILHRDTQPLVLRDISGNIMSFALIYINREEQYASINSIEVNQKYLGNEEVEKEIFYKYSKLAEKFAKEYNKENPDKPLNFINCGVATRSSINRFIEKLEVCDYKMNNLDFSRFGYSNDISWPGDYHYDTYLIWKNKNNQR